MPKSKNKIRRKRPVLKRAFNNLIINIVNRFSFVDFVKKIALLEKNQSFYNYLKQTLQEWQYTEKIKEIAVKQTIAQFEKNNERVKPGEIKKLISEMAIQYNRDIHINAATSIDMAFRHIFDYPDKNLPFISPDGRDIKHLDKLKLLKKEGHGVVYLINHSSHLDEFIFNLFCQRLNLGLPVFAAGQNMMTIKSIARLLMVASYVVLRKGASKYQMAALYNYCSALSKTGSQQGIFLEAWRGGARTRDGSLRYPKKLVTLKGAIDVDNDVIIQPVAISYSTVPEDLMMCSKKSAVSWVRGMGFLKTILKIPFYPKTFFLKSLKNIYGRAFITMPEPILLSDLRKSHSKDKTGISLDEFVALFSIKEIAKNKKIMSSQLVARALNHARKTKSNKLRNSINFQLEDINEYHEHIFNQKADPEDFITKNNTSDIIKDGLKTLKNRGVISKWKKDVHGLPFVKDENALLYYATHGDRRLYSPTSDQNIVVVGAGHWGFALASHIGLRLLDDKKYNNASLTIYDPRIEIAKQMGLTRYGPGRFFEKMLPKNVFVTSDLPGAFRKASEIIIASKPEDFENHTKNIIKVSEQPLKIIIATRGFIPGTNKLPYHFLRQLVSEYKRNDIEIFILAGPVNPEDLVGNKKITGIFAGTSGSVNQLAELFEQPLNQVLISQDPIGVHVADILARIYSVWLNFMISSNKLKNSSDIGHFTASIGSEVRQFAIASGASAETFNIGSIPWTGTFVAVCMDGPWHEFGKKLGQYAKKRNNGIYKYIKQLNVQLRNEGKKLSIIEDMKEFLKCTETMNIDMPIMKKAYRTFTVNNHKKLIR